MRLIIIAIFSIIAVQLHAQHRLTIKITDGNTVLPSASIKLSPGGNTGVTDSTGQVKFNNLKPGQYKIEVSFIGYEPSIEKLAIGNSDISTTITLKPSEEEAEEEVIIQSTRTSRTIQNVPTRVETIDLEEINEKNNMRPANVAMLLHESTGIQVQQTSATSGNAGIRIQGLDGRYTQLLKDGFANFGNFASGLSVLEIPPLDLKQVEIIKGPASTLYGGGSIAGVINFVSKTPTNKMITDILINQSNIGQSNIGVFSSGRNKKTGYTLLALYSRQRLYDVDKDDFTEIPRNKEFTIHPKLFFYPSEKSSIIIGNSFSNSTRTGGDVQVIEGRKGNEHQYFEENKSTRNISTFEFIQRAKSGRVFNAKQSVAIFDRHISIPSYHFHGKNTNSFTDISYLFPVAKHNFVTGVNINYDNFIEKDASAGDRDNKNLSAGAYVQDTWDISDALKLESGLRLEHARFSNSLFAKSKTFILPRVSLLARFSGKLTSRIGAGLGYKTPTLFTERSESIQYEGVQQLLNVKPETSYGGTADINYRTRLGSHFDFSFNHLFFYSHISNPLVLENVSPGNTKFVNEDAPVQSYGVETNAKFIYRKNLKLFLGYTYTHAIAEYLPANRFLPLVPKHRLNSALIYEKEAVIKMGLEAYYTGPQFLYNGLSTPGYWEVGFMAEKLFRNFSVYINFENLTDTRQSNYKRVANDPHATPTFDDIWTHTEGFVVNAGIKVRI